MAMKPITASMLVFFMLTAGNSTVSHAAESAYFPNKPIRIVVPFPPGGSNDLLARYFADKLVERVNQQVVIDNRGGANGIIGTQLAAGSMPDGYTLLAISVSYSMNAAVRKLPYDVVTSFDPIAMFGTNSNCIVTSPGSGLSDLKGIIARAKAKPGSLSYASTGVGGFNHFGGELFNKMAGVDIVHVPYKGGGPAMIDLIGGQIPLMFSTVTQVLPYVRTSQLKIIAVGADKRSPAVPDVPTFAEAGLPGYEVYGWWGISTPAGVPLTVRKRLTRAFSEILQDPATRKRLAAEAAEPRDMEPEAMRAFIRDEVKKWSEIAAGAGIRVN
jgi:tripartite-type tricarboxylate transporter receptor subunit TctC